jgi:hypothetical protein
VKDVFKAAVANQYQMILVAAATALSVATLSPFPFLILLGGEMLTMPFLLERIQKRLEIEKKYAAREVETLSQEQRYEQLSMESKSRFGQFKRVCGQIQENYRALSSESQGMLADQSNKFDAMLAVALRRLWLVQKYEQMIRAFDLGKVRSEIESLHGMLSAKDIKPRMKEAWEQNLAIKEKLVESADRNIQNRTAILTELDSLESLLQLLLQKSLAATDAAAFTADIDDILSQAEADAASVQEMEQLMGAMPELRQSTLSERVRGTTDPLPFVAKTLRDRQKR